VKIGYKTHIQNRGWNLQVVDGTTSGTVGEGLRMEALILELLEKNGLDIAIEAQAHVQNVGWQPLKTDGEIIGTVGESLRLEAIRIRLKGLNSDKYSIKYRVHVENIGWQNWCKDGEVAGTTSVALRAEAIEIVLEKHKEDVVVVVPNTPTDDPTQKIIPITNPNIAIPPEKILCASYSTHVENYGWGKDVTDGRLSGKVGQGLRIEAIRIGLINYGNLNLGVAYSTHVENQGWLPEVVNNATSGTTDQGLRLEAIKIRLTGTDSDKYSIWYRVHVQNIGWQDWCRDGDVAGTTGYALQAEAIQIIITLKSQNILRNPGEAPLIAVNYRSHIQNLAWGSWVKNGAKSGTTGLGLRMEAFEANLTSLDGLNIGISYRVHIQNVGWQEWKSDGVTAGTVGQSLRIEAIEIVLTGADASKYTVQYRGHLENSGWTSWKKNGATLGTTGQELRLEAISIVLIKNVDLNTTITNEIKNKAPIIQIWASDFPKADVLLHDIRTEYELLSAKMVEGINKSTGFNFTIDPEHPHYKKLRKMSTTILVYEIYSNLKKERIFEGRITSDEEGWNKTRDVTCEGELGYLLDSIQRPATYVNVTPEQWMTMVLDNHNSQVTSDKRLHMGICTVLGDGSGVNISTVYRTHIENLSWLSWVQNGVYSGTTGSALRMEALELKLDKIGSLNIGVTYRVHLGDIGWQEWKSDGATAGTVSQGIRMEAIEIKLTGEDAGKFSIQYCVHVQNVGWQDWKKDGETAGTTGQALQAEAISIAIVSKVDGTNGKLVDGLFRENDYCNTLELIKTTMLDTLGGVLVIERIGGIKFLNYLENYGSVNSQPIMFGVNLLDYNKITDASGIYTALVPYGKEIDGKKLTIATVNNDCDYIYDELAVAEYGWIFKEWEWPDIDSPSALLYAAKLKLAGLIKQGISLDLTALDLSMVNVDIQKFQVGDMVRCVSQPHEFDTFLSVSKKERDLFEPGNDTTVLGGVTQSLTDRISGPLGGGIMGFAITTANTVKNMEYVANELSFQIKITADTVTEQGTTINETKLEMTAFQISLSALETRTLETETAIDAAELKITPQAITQTVRSSVDYTADLANKASTADLAGKASATDLGALTSRVSTAEQKITSDAIVLTVTQSSTYTNAMTGKVSTNNVINSINLSTEGIKISADKITISGFVTFTEAQNLANTAESNAESTAATLASNARTGAVGDINTKLGTKQSTTFIDGGNISTANLTFTGGITGSMFGITSSFSISTDGNINIPSSGVLNFGSTNKGTITKNSSAALWISNPGDIYIAPFSGYYTRIYSLSAEDQPRNIPLTSTTAANKINKIQYIPNGSEPNDYVQFELASPSWGQSLVGVNPWQSDRNLKTNIQESKIDALATISKIRPRSYNWKRSGEYEDCGFIAQEIEQDLGEKHVMKIKQDDGSISYQLKEKGFVPLLTKAIQELNAKLTATTMKQANEIATLKYQIKELKGEKTC